MRKHKKVNNNRFLLLILSICIVLVVSVSYNFIYSEKAPEDTSKVLDAIEEVILEDERLTTVISNNIMIKADVSRKKRKKKVDAIAAQLILQSY